MKAINKQHLIELIDLAIKQNGYDCDLNHIDVSDIQDMSNLFKNSKFNGNISKWNTENVTDTSGMFLMSCYDKPLNLNTSKVTNMNSMFGKSKFNSSLNLNTSKVTNFGWMFYDSDFDQPLDFIDTSNALNIGFVLYKSRNTQHHTANNWDVSKVTVFEAAFQSTQLKLDLTDWDVSSGTCMGMMFKNSIMDFYFGKWDVRKVRNM
ncbi:MAG: BspA family leucine-rich repeat surface protein, partial [Alphaproteobacteria bacterium]